MTKRPLLFARNTPGRPKWYLAPWGEKAAQRLLRGGLILLAVPLLAGCEIEPAGYLIEGGNHSLTVERKKPYFWSTGWELDLIVTRYPECQRRYALQKAGEKVRVDLYRTDGGAFILNQGDHWYVAETRNCRFQQFKDEPDEPGAYVGAFRPKSGVLAFVPNNDSKAGAGKE